ncbi:GNAT family N-acetyltransferase [Longispora sp. K20-0274]|uniref:GNAT family N-acetyltransferase n=1 Tax=Longispora sp. K20-0274 TaxID=3088255 RepID=UPI00399A65E1
MTLRVTKFDGEYPALAAWTGEPVAELRAMIEEYHSEERDTWLAWDGDGVVGALHPWRRPDGRHTLYFGPTRPDAYAPLAATVPGEVYVTVPDDEVGLFEGFVVERREYRYLVPVSVFDAPVPAGIALVSAAEVGIELMALDCALREDVPGADGWRPDPVWFREETWDSPFFDPEAYLVAVATPKTVAGPGAVAAPGAGTRAGAGTGLDAGVERDLVGLVRVWNGPRPVPRLGMVGVLPGYRKRGLAKALVGAAFRALHARGVPEVACEVDAANTGSNALFRGLGGRVVGVDVELRRPV